MRLYIGHICMAIVIGAVAMALVFAVFFGITAEDGPQYWLVYGTFGSLLVALVFGAVASVTWRPKWDRDEQRGRGLSERLDAATLPPIPAAPVGALSEAQDANERGKE